MNRRALSQDVYACAGYCSAIDGRTDTYIGPFGTPGARQSAVAVNEVTNSVYIASDRANSDPLGVALAGFVNVFRGEPRVSASAGASLTPQVPEWRVLQWGSLARLAPRR